MATEKFPMESTIEIDCDPWHGMGRQQEYYEALCKKLGVEPRERISAFFGCWEWPITYQTKEQKEQAKSYIVDLYQNGIIRYGSW